MRDIYRVLKPGGWCQLSELYLNAQSDNGTLAVGTYFRFPGLVEILVDLSSLPCSKLTFDIVDSALSRWSAGYLRGSQLQKDPRIATKLGHLLKLAGFSEIKCQMFKMPMSDWSAGMFC